MSASPHHGRPIDFIQEVRGPVEAALVSPAARSRTLSRRRAGALAALVAACLLGVGCPGDGTKVPLLDDDDGQGPRLPFPPRLSEISSRVFAPSCAPGCHEPGGVGPFSLRTASEAYASLVGVPNGEGIQGPSGLMARVEPGAPEVSYLILKLEGAPGIVGERMPLGLPPLDPEVVDTIAEWISRGAAND